MRRLVLALVLQSGIARADETRTVDLAVGASVRSIGECDSEFKACADLESSSKAGLALQFGIGGAVAHGSVIGVRLTYDGALAGSERFGIESAGPFFRRHVGRGSLAVSLGVANPLGVRGAIAAGYALVSGPHSSIRASVEVSFVEHVRGAAPASSQFVALLVTVEHD